MRNIVLLGFVFLAGCISRATLVEQTYSEPKSGQIELAWNILSSKADAMEKAQIQMENFCAPHDPIIVSETMRDSSKIIIRQNSAEVVRRPVIAFTCRP